MPFANLSDDREQQYFADGITEDVTTDLSRITDMFVIARNTAFTYRNKPVYAKQIGRELGVRYVLEGSVQRSGNQLRVTTQLIDAAINAHLWAERFDRETGELFALQNEITGRIANALNAELIDAEAAQPAENPDTLDYILRGRAAWNKGPTRDNYAQAIRLFEGALALDPGSVDAQSWLANALVTRVNGGLADSAAADIARAEGLVGQVLAASPRSALAHWVKAQVLRAQGRCDAAIPEYQTAIALNRNSVGAYANLGWCKFVVTGSIEELISLQEQAIRLSRYDSFIGYWYGRMGFAHLLQSHTDEAIIWFEKAASANPGLWDSRCGLAAAYALKGDLDRAAAELAEARRLRLDGRYSSIARLKATGVLGMREDSMVPKIRALFETTYLVGLRKAGMPEE
jgi:adenylate cyclase